MERTLILQYPQNARLLDFDCAVSHGFNPEYEDKPYIQSRALWDTGAESSGISTNLAKKLGLIPIASQEVNHLSGSSEVNIHEINLLFPNDLKINRLKVFEVNLPERIDILIGMDIISIGDFYLINKDNHKELTFRVSYKN